MSRSIVLEQTIHAFYQTGIFLLDGMHNVWSGLGGADDLGYFFYGTSIAVITGLAPYQAGNLFFYGSVVVSFLLLLLSLFVAFPSFYAVVIVALGLIRLWMPLQELNHPYVAYLLAVSVIPVILLIQRKQTTYMSMGVCFVSGSILGIADTVRIHAALPVFVFALFYFLGAHFLTMRTKLIALSVLVCGYAIPRLHFLYEVHKRDTFLIEHGYPVPHTQSHLFWHNIYAGFGFVQNDYGIEWTDTCAAQAALQENVDAHYAKPLYEETVRALIFKLCKEKRYFVMITLFAKIGVVIYYFLLYFGWLGLLVAYYYPKPWYIEGAFVCAMGVSALPGILTLPVTAYLIGFISCTIIYTLYSVLWAYASYKKKSV